MDDDGRRRRTDNGACLYYKLTCEPKASGELKKIDLELSADIVLKDTSCLFPCDFVVQHVQLGFSLLLF